jgi:flagellar biosynthesis/type III secretory pathway ATPase
VIRSISRVRGDVTDDAHNRAARRVIALLSIYEEIEDLVNIRAYVPGVNVDFDVAVEARPKILQYLQQSPGSPSTMEQSKKQLFELVAWIDQLEKTLRAQHAKPANKAPATR